MKRVLVTVAHAMHDSRKESPTADMSRRQECLADGLDGRVGLWLGKGCWR